MDTGKTYYDSEGNECSIWQIVRREPIWAAVRIQEGEKAIDEIARLRAEAEANRVDAERLTDPGYVRVPVEPTARMLTAGYSARQETLKRFALGGAIAPADDGMRSAYRAMLVAATKETSHD